MAEIDASETGGSSRAFVASAAGRPLWWRIALYWLLLPVAGLPLHAAPPGDQLPVNDAGRRPFSESVSIARATWDTGWFQAEIFVGLLEALGYRVSPPRTMDNQAFYRAAAKGEVDLWVNGWFPSHDVFLAQEGIRGKARPVGYEVIAGALQGYMVDQRTAREQNITTLADLGRPEVAEAFDRDGDGRADLIGCNPGWGCERVVEHHLSAYDLRDTVAHVQGDYSPLMEDAIERYRRGESILFYTWTPNWTVGTLVPGRDVVWIPVPHPSLPPGQQGLEADTVIEGVPGCAADPCALGFPPNDIRGVANVRFLEGHPDIGRLLESVRIPLVDISRQNARMIDGEGTYEDIRRHAQEWIDENREAVNRWVAAARSLQRQAEGEPRPDTGSDRAAATGSLRVVTLRSEPFVIYRDGTYVGFSIELWEAIARELGMAYEIYGVNTIAKLLDEVKRGAAEVAVAGIGITSVRERELDFSHAYYESGLQILVPKGSGSVLRKVLSKIHRVVFSREAMYALGVFLAVLMLAAHVIWVLERRVNPQFPKSYPRGIWQSIWWAVVTVTTVGYGDTTPKGTVGRLFGIFWILAGYFVFAYFTASVTTTATVQEIYGTIGGPEDLYGKKIATVARSTAASYLADQGLSAARFENVDEAYRMLASGEVEAVVYDAPVLQHYVAGAGRGTVEVVGLMFQEKSYGMAFRFRSPHRDRVNIALLELMENGVYQQICDRWFGK
jgi:ABC-type proline/glycine betaine transport system substrate-binding protein/ABC-type amino acid transport substrate-binding protein